MFYTSTRDNNIRLKASEAILKGLSDDGGLFVPCEMPKLNCTLEKLSRLNYQETAYEVMKLFLDDYTEEELKECINKAYDNKFDTGEIAPLAEVDDSYYLELFHGSTIAFKDMALSILPHLMTVAAKKNHMDKEIVILTATSGDTGKAALAGFAGVPGTRIIVFYPKHGVSKVQELQMVTQKESNTCVIGVEGNFDDCQSKVKELFGDVSLKEQMNQKGFCFSSANSINIGRLVPQIVYYAYAYGKLLGEERIAEGDSMNVVVPTGNFGNILAAYYAKKIGIPIGKLICASNENKVLFDFFQTGDYDKNREFILTQSPSMDILISSNLERLIYQMTGCNSDENKKLMESLKESGHYHVTEQMRNMTSDFVGGYANWEECSQKIKELYENTGYVIDTHTAVAATVYDKYVRETNDSTKTVIVSTASPFKFARSVMSAIDSTKNDMDDFELIDLLSKTANVDIPNAITEIRNAKIVHQTVCRKDEMKRKVMENLGI